EEQVAHLLTDLEAAAGGHRGRADGRAAGRPRQGGGQGGGRVDPRLQGQGRVGRRLVDLGDRGRRRREGRGHEGGALAGGGVLVERHQVRHRRAAARVKAGGAL